MKRGSYAAKTHTSPPKKLTLLCKQLKWTGPYYTLYATPMFSALNGGQYSVTRCASTVLHAAQNPWSQFWTNCVSYAAKIHTSPAKNKLSFARNWSWQNCITRCENPTISVLKCGQCHVTGCASTVLHATQDPWLQFWTLSVSYAAKVTLRPPKNIILLCKRLK